jgi:hypothetical protein
MGASRMRWRWGTSTPSDEKVRMPTPLLQTKLTRPAVRRAGVLRPRLVALPDDRLRLGHRLADLGACRLWQDDDGKSLGPGGG